MQHIFRKISKIRKKPVRFASIFSVYVIFWSIFYGLYIILPKKWMIFIAEKTGVFMSIYIFILVPLLSFLIPRYIIRHMRTRPWVMYLIHTLILVVFLIAFFTLSFLKAYTSVSPEDFV